MNWIVLFFTLGVVLADSNRNGYKTYKNFKVFDVTGNNLESLRDFRKHIETEEVSKPNISCYNHVIKVGILNIIKMQKK